MAASCRRSSLRLSVKGCSTRALSEKLMIIATSPESIWSISSPICRLASSSRVGSDVAGVHAGRIIDQKNQAAVEQLRTPPAGPQQGQNGQRHDQQLQQ